MQLPYDGGLYDVLTSTLPLKISMLLAEFQEFALKCPKPYLCFGTLLSDRAPFYIHQLGDQVGLLEVEEAFPLKYRHVE